MQIESLKCDLHTEEAFIFKHNNVQQNRYEHHKENSHLHDISEKFVAKFTLTQHGPR